MITYAVCILTCRKPKYAERIFFQQGTVRFLRSLGVQVYYLYGDASLNKHTLNYLDTHVELTVPVSEDYEWIPHRIYAAFDVLRSLGHTGVIKMDDDIEIKNPNKWIEYTKLLCNYPYAAMKGVGGREIKEKEGTIILNTYHQSASTHPLLRQQFSVFPSIEYASGPMYWVRQDFMERLMDTDYRKCVFEDVCTGIAAKKHGIPLAHLDNVFNTIVKGDDGDYEYDQYMVKNLLMWKDIIYA
jgi:hypothetical protein